MDIYLLLSVFLGISALLAYIFERIGFSRIAGYIITGFSLSFLFSESLKANKELLDFFSEIAITLLIFEIGREIGIEKIRRMNLVPMLILSFEIAFAFFLALLFGNLLKLNFIEVLILATIASFSSTTIVFKLLSELKFSEETKKEILTVTVLDDIYAILILAILPNLGLGGFELAEFLRLLVYSLIVTAILVFSGVSVVRRLFVRIVEPNELGVAIILGSAFLFAILSKSFGLSPALGAFAAGIALSAHPKNLEISEYLRPLREIFLILFFVTLGSEAGLMESFSPILFLSIFIVFFRFLAFTSANWFTTRNSLQDSVKIGFVASSVGEFGMVITYEATKLGYVGVEFLTLSALSIILGAMVSSGLSRNADKYAEKIASAMPIELKVLVGRISVNVSRVVEGRTSEIVRETFFRILRNVLLLVFAIILSSSALYIADNLFPSLSVYISLLVFSFILFAILLVGMKTRKYAEELCCMFVEKSGLNPVLKEVLVNSTFLALILLSVDLALLTTGSFLSELAYRVYKIEISHFVTVLALILFFSVFLLIYRRLRRISL